MKLYADYAGSSISIADSTMLRAAVNELAELNVVSVIIETGTYNGLGSTKMLAEAFKNSSKLRSLITLEINAQFHKEAKQNMKDYAFVKCIHGLSLKRGKALEFLKNDEVLQDHWKYPELFIDDVKNPTEFYINEIEGRLSGFFPGKSLMHKLFKVGVAKEGLLDHLMRKYYQETILFVLDSAGGTGHLEFLTVKETMGAKHYYLLLDDIHHLKHFRGFQIINSSDQYRILAHSNPEGWVLAEFLPDKYAAQC